MTDGSVGGVTLGGGGGEQRQVDVEFAEDRVPSLDLHARLPVDDSAQ